MNEETLTEGEMETAKEWIKENHKDIKPSEWINTKYIDQLNIKLPTL